MSAGGAKVGRIAPLERAAVAEEVASVVRHDLRNRLASIRNAVYFLDKKLGQGSSDQDPRIARFLTLIQEQVASANEILSERATHDGLFGAERGDVSLEPLVARALEESARFRPEEASRIRIDATGRVMIDADPREVVLAIQCLLENALDVANERVRVSVRDDGIEAHVEVIDDGPGFADDAVAQATTAFFTTKPGHAGLGLNIASRVARRYGGRLEVAPNSESRGGHVALCFPKLGGHDG